MKTKYIYITLFVALFMAGCFEDEGNYTYLPESSPSYLFKSPNHMYCYEGVFVLILQILWREWLI